MPNDGVAAQYYAGTLIANTRRPHTKYGLSFLRACFPYKVWSSSFLSLRRSFLLYSFPCILCSSNGFNTCQNTNLPIEQISRMPPHCWMQQKINLSKQNHFSFVCFSQTFLFMKAFSVNDFGVLGTTNYQDTSRKKSSPSLSRFLLFQTVISPDGYGAARSNSRTSLTGAVFLLFVWIQPTAWAPKNVGMPGQPGLAILTRV